MDKLTKNNYSVKNWNTLFPNNEVILSNLNIDNSWTEFFKKEIVQKQLKEIGEYLSHCLKVTNGEVNIFPYPELLFSALNMTPLYQVKVVILGQDPYFKFEQNTKVPQAMGLSFSVPKGIKIPPSLANIYKNLLKYKHINKEPPHGNLAFLSYQGVLLLNTSLTVQEGCPNSHEKIWKGVTDELIKYISDNTEHVVFMLWGGPSFSKLNLIDTNKHKVSISSHPSPLSYSNKLRNYDSFENTDHFGETNKYLTENGKSSILWEII